MRRRPPQFDGVELALIVAMIVMLCVQAALILGPMLAGG